jgi:CRISPR/Cas system-associated protein Cas10 (large subunit of type III CRISPR-Cas system)
MGRDKEKDDKHFNCNQDHEIDYVSNLYMDSEKVKKFLKKQCDLDNISYSTHKEVYKLIKRKLGLPIPN